MGPPREPTDRIRPRLLFTDVDRTLLTHAYHLPEAVAAAAAAARSAGIAIVLATARSPTGVRSIAERLDAQGPCICCNGAWISDVRSGVASDVRSLAPTDARAVVAAATATGLGVLWYTATDVFAVEDTPSLRRQVDITGDRLNVVAGMDELPGAPLKVMCVCTAAHGPVAFEALRGRFHPALSIVGSSPVLLEVGPPGVSKQQAAAVIAGRLNLSPALCAAAGDAENDLSLLGWAGVAVTVSNGVPEARRLAQFVAPCCDDRGMATALTWLIAARSDMPGVG